MQGSLPGVLFTMRYPDNTGYVWNTIAQLRDDASAALAGQATCFIAFPRLTGTPSYALRHARPVELDVYDNTPAGAVRIAEFVRANAVKVVVFMSALPDTVNLRLLRSLGVRTLNTENNGFDHIPPDRLPVQLMKQLVRGVLGLQMHDLHLANSRAQQSFLRRHAKMPARRVALMEDSVDCERFSPGPRAAALAASGLDPQRRWLICVAQSRPEKRLDAIVRVAARVIAARPDSPIGFVYVGDGDTVPPARALAESLGIAAQFHFAGRQNDLVPFYRSADFMVHAAEMESFGLAIVEAMACGLPVVACAAAGPRETILDGQTGVLVGLNDFDAFTSAVLDYIDKPALRAQHGRAARAHVLSRYSMQRQAADLARYIGRFI